MPRLIGPTALLLAAGPFVSPEVVRADQPIVPPITARDESRVDREEPRAAFVLAGAGGLALAYGGSIAAAALSQHGLDRSLYIPLLGPWLDLAGRDSCGFSDQRPCYREGVNKVLLASDGVIQSLGLAALLFGVIRPAPAAGSARSPQLQLGMVPLGRGDPGVAAFGTF
jgi:hypothetical protein